MLAKKITLFIFFSLLCGTLCLSAEEIVLARPEKEQIVLGISRIKQEERAITIKRYAFLTCLVGAGCYAGYKIFWQGPAIPQSSPAGLAQTYAKASQAVAIGQETRNLVKVMAGNLGIKLASNKLPSAITPQQPTATTPTTPAATTASGDNFLRSSYNWCKNQSGQIFQLTAATLLCNALLRGMGPVGKYFNRFDGFVDKWLSHIFHDDNLAWYLESHTHFDNLLPELQSYVDDRTAFIEIWSLLVQDLEGMVAFMYLQAENLEHKNTITAQRAEAIAKTVIEQAEWAATSIEPVLIAQDAEAIQQIVIEYQEKLNKSIEHFKFIELFRVG